MQVVVFGTSAISVSLQVVLLLETNLSSLVNTYRHTVVRLLAIVQMTITPQSETCFEGNSEISTLLVLWKIEREMLENSTEVMSYNRGQLVEVYFLMSWDCDLLFQRDKCNRFPSKNNRYGKVFFKCVPELGAVG